MIRLTRNYIRTVVGALFVTVFLVGMICSPIKAGNSYPAKPIRLIVNQAPGGSADVAARVLADALGKELGTSIVVINNTEAGGTAAVNEVYKAEPDGYTLLSALLPRMIQQEILLTPGYHSDELTSVYNFIRGTFVLAVNKNSPYKDLPSLVEASQKKPITVGVTGMGSATHFQTVRLQDEVEANFVIVPFSGAATAASAAMGGHIDAVTLPINVALQSDDKLRILATPTAERVDLIPDVPSVTEFGYQASDVSFYQAIMAPPGLPSEIRDVLEGALDKLLHDPAFIKRLEGIGEASYPMNGEALSALIKDLQVLVDEYKDVLK